jgi:hypothetical protein
MTSSRVIDLTGEIGSVPGIYDELGPHPLRPIRTPAVIDLTCDEEIVDLTESTIDDLDVEELCAMVHAYDIQDDERLRARLASTSDEFNKCMYELMTVGNEHIEELMRMRNVLMEHMTRDPRCHMLTREDSEALVLRKFPYLMRLGIFDDELNALTAFVMYFSTPNPVHQYKACNYIN